MPKTDKRDVALAIMNRSKVINFAPFYGIFFRGVACVHQKRTSIFGHNSYNYLLNNLIWVVKIESHD